MALFKHEYSIETPIALLDIIESGIIETDIEVTSDMFRKQTIDTGDWKFGDSPASKWKQTIASSSSPTQSSQKSDISKIKSLKQEKPMCSPKKIRRTNCKVQQKSLASKSCASQEVVQNHFQEKVKSKVTQKSQMKKSCPEKINQNPGQEKQRKKPAQKTQVTKPCAGQSQVKKNEAQEKQTEKLSDEVDKNLFKPKNVKSGRKMVETKTAEDSSIEKIKNQIPLKEKKDSSIEKIKSQSPFKRKKEKKSTTTTKEKVKRAKSNDKKEDVLNIKSVNTKVGKSKMKSKDISVDTKDNTGLQKHSNNVLNKLIDNHSLQGNYTETKQHEKWDKKGASERKRKQNKKLENRHNNKDKVKEKIKNKEVKRIMTSGLESGLKSHGNLGIDKDDHVVKVDQKKSTDEAKQKDSDRIKDDGRLKNEVVFQKENENSYATNADKIHSTVYQLWKSTVGSNCLDQNPFKKSTDKKEAQCSVLTNEKSASFFVSTNKTTASSLVMTNKKDNQVHSGQDKYISLEKDSFMWSVESSHSSTETSEEMDVSTNEISQSSETLHDESFLPQDITYQNIDNKENGKEKESASSFNSTQDPTRDDNIKELKQMLSDLLTPDVGNANNMPKIETSPNQISQQNSACTSNSIPESHKLDEVVQVLFNKRKRSKVRSKKSNSAHKCNENLMQKGFGKCSYCGLVCVLGKSMQLHEMTHRSKILLSIPDNMEMNNELSTLIETSPVKKHRSESSKVKTNIQCEHNTSVQSPCNLSTMTYQPTASSQEMPTGVLLILPREVTQLGNSTLNKASPTILLNFDPNKSNVKSLPIVNNIKFSQFRNESGKLSGDGGHYHGNSQDKGHDLDQNNGSCYVEPDQDQCDMTVNSLPPELNQYDKDALCHKEDKKFINNCEMQNTLGQMEKLCVKNNSDETETLDAKNAGTSNLSSDFNEMYHDRNNERGKGNKSGSCGGCVKVLKIIVVKDSLTQEKLEVPVSECQCKNPEMCFQKDSSENSPNAENSQESQNMVEVTTSLKKDFVADSAKTRTYKSTPNKKFKSEGAKADYMYRDSDVEQYGYLLNSGDPRTECVYNDSDNGETSFDSGCARTHVDYKYFYSGTCSRTNICFGQLKALKKARNSVSNLNKTEYNSESILEQNVTRCCQDNKMYSKPGKENCYDDTESSKDKNEKIGYRTTKSGMEIGQEVQIIRHDRLNDLQTVCSDFISPPKKRWRNYLTDRVNDINTSEKIDSKRNKFKRSINFDSVDVSAETKHNLKLCTEPKPNHDDVTDFHNSDMQQSPINSNHGCCLGSELIMDSTYHGNSYHGNLDLQHSVKSGYHSEVYNDVVDVGNEMIFETADLLGNHDDTSLNHSFDETIDNELNCYDNFHVYSCARLIPYISNNFQCARVMAVDIHNSARTRPIKLHRLQMS